MRLYCCNIRITTVEPGKLDVGATEGHDLQHIGNQKMPTGPPEDHLSLKSLPPSEENNDDAQILPSPVLARPEDGLFLRCSPQCKDEDDDDDDGDVDCDDDDDDVQVRSPFFVFYINVAFLILYFSINFDLKTWQCTLCTLYTIVFVGLEFSQHVFPTDTWYTMLLLNDSMHYQLQY
uniref:Uncharacterized protein n=1 Tax=Papio anubis TaxID=9555 RepID=A0A8I5N8W5_PAPAN